MKFSKASPSHGAAALHNCSSIGPFYMMQSSQQWTAPAQASLRVKLSPTSFTYFSTGSSLSCRCASAPPLTSPGCRETACRLTIGYRRIPPLSYLPSLLLHWPLCPCSYFSHISLPRSCPADFSPLKYAIAEIIPPPLIGLALASEAGLTWSWDFF